MALSGTYYGSTSDAYIYPTVIWSATQSTTNNYSEITATLYYSRHDRNTTSGNWSGSITIKPVSGYGEIMDGYSQTKSGSVSGMRIYYVSGTVAITHTVRIRHNNSGQGRFTISVTGAIPNTSLTSTKCSSGTLKLNNITITSTISISLDDITIAGDTSEDEVSTTTITISTLNTSYKHNIRYSYGDTKETISEGLTGDTEYNVDWSPDIKLVAETPNIDHGKAGIFVDTYNGSTLVSTNMVYITLRVPARIAPVIPDLILKNTYPNFGAYIKDRSAVKYTPNVTIADLSSGVADTATLKTIKVSLNGESLVTVENNVEYTSSIISETGIVTFSVVATDSRGRITAKARAFNVYDYTSPTASINVSRCEEDGTLDDTGTNVKVEASGSVGLLFNGVPAKTNKNIIVYPFSWTTRTSKGITFTDNGDGSVRVSGTCTKNTSFIVASYSMVSSYFPDLEGQTVTLSGCPSGGSKSTYMLQAYRASTSGTVTPQDYGDGVSFTWSAGEASCNIAISVRSGTTLDVVFYPQLELGSTKTDYEPYTGQTENELTATLQYRETGTSAWTTVETKTLNPSRNYLIQPYSHSTRTISGVAFTVNSDGSVNVNGTATADASFSLAENDRIQDSFTHLKGKTVTLSGCPDGGTASTYMIYGAGVGGNVEDYGSGTTFVWNPDTSSASIQIVVKSGTTIDKTFYPQLELGTIKSSYEPYNGYDGTYTYNGVINNMSDAYPYEYQIIITDSTGATVTRSASVGVGYATVDYRDGGKGIAFGTTSTEDGFLCAMTPKFSGKESVQINVQTSKAGSKTLIDIRDPSTDSTTSDGQNIYIGAGGNTVIGSGEFAENMLDGAYDTCTAIDQENLFLGSDGNTYIYSNGNTIADRKKWTFNTDGTLVDPDGSKYVREADIGYKTSRSGFATNATGTWLYRQFPDGIMECILLEYRVPGDSGNEPMTASDTWTFGYFTGKIQLPKYPVAFTDVPFCTIEYVGSDTNQDAQVVYCGTAYNDRSVLKTNPRPFKLWRQTTTTFGHPIFSCHAIGRYK